MAVDRSHSLKGRLMVRLTLAVLAATGLFIGGLLLDFLHDAREIQEQSMLDLARTLKSHPNGLLDPESGAADRPVARGVTVRTLAGETLVRPVRWAIDTPSRFPFQFGDHDYQLGHDLDTAEPLFAVSVTVSPDRLGLDRKLGIDRAGPLILQIARPVTETDAILESFFIAILHQMWWVFAGLLLATALIVRFTVKHTVRALDRASAAAQAITPDTIDRRVPADGLPREIAPLVDTVNRTLDRIERAYRAERSFAAGAAHELRTPLSVLRARIECLQPEAKRREALAAVDRMARLLEQLLQLARLETWPEPPDRQPADAIARRVVSELAVGFVRAGGNVTFDPAPDAAAWRVDPLLFEVVLRNLLENARRYGGAPPQARVTLTAERLVVEDAGPGIPEAEREQVFEMFWRGRAERADGAGLGLALVRRIAGLLGAEVRLDDAEPGNRDLGGARFTVVRRDGTGVDARAAAGSGTD